MGSVNDESLRELEVNAMVDLYDRIKNNCMEKCLQSNITDPGLSTGESVCMNRCVAKFFEVHTIVGEKIQEMTLAEQQAQTQNSANK